MLAVDCDSQMGLEGEGVWVREAISTRTDRTIENRDVLGKVMGLTHVFGCPIPPVGCDRALRDGAKQFPFSNGEGHLGAFEFERNGSNMILPSMFPSGNAGWSKAMGDWALMRLVNGRHRVE